MRRMKMHIGQLYSRVGRWLLLVLGHACEHNLWWLLTAVVIEWTSRSGSRVFCCQVLQDHSGMLPALTHTSQPVRGGMSDSLAGLQNVFGFACAQGVVSPRVLAQHSLGSGILG
ncbi:hypothetical protein B0T21DRAFT_97058 [Apiosordaria backusii]|uniref:Uncharacterized protein n=1 Tax=Apiosordaria backusii TaxID=314023 RepID=A0AA40ET27_9PEZI|nr:hypothetical protein B0T21DRAFT_97058 [Apiosordaria backusii]